MKIVKLDSPFYTAGRFFNWSGDLTGFGINKRLLLGDGDIGVKVDEVLYTISKEKARILNKKYNSNHKARNTILAVIPKQEFICRTSNNIFESEKSDSESESSKSLQSTLF